MIIYKVTNLINNKIYIGLTKNSLKLRISEHISASNTHNDNMYIHKAILKYDKENFKWEIIDNANNIEELIEKEKYWIKYYNANNKNIGYNLTSGGDGLHDYKPSKETKEKISKSLKGKRIKNLVGYKFGKLIVIKNTDKREKCGNIFWLCKCDCGNEISVSSSNLKGKNSTKSCGCINRERIISYNKSIRKYNYNLINKNHNYKNIEDLKNFCLLYNINYDSIRGKFYKNQNHYKDWIISRELINTNE